MKSTDSQPHDASPAASAAPFAAETARIAAEYERRDRELPADFYALSRPANLFAHQARQRALHWALAATAAFPMIEKRVLDVGCGEGEWLDWFVALGATPANLAGIELDPTRAAACGARFPAADIRSGNAAELPWPDASFDVVLQSVLFTSILSDSMRQQAAREMLRVTRAGGRLVWYDFVYNNPQNPHVRGIRRGELRRLFPGCRIRWRRVTLAPPLARRIVPWSWSLGRVLEKLWMLNTHDIAAIEKD